MPRLRRPGPSPWRARVSGAHTRAWPGTGPLVVLVHGSGQTSRTLVPLGRRLAALGLRVLAPDLPAPSVPQQARLVADLLRATGPAVVVGCSGGSRAAVQRAAEAPAA